MIRFLSVVMTLWFLSTHAVLATEKPVAPDLAMPLFLKILSYDQSFQFDKDRVVDLYLPFDKADAASYEQYRAARSYFQKNESVTVFGARVTFLPICCDTSEQTLEQAKRDHYSIMVLTTMTSEKITGLLKVARDKGVRSYTLDAAQLTLGVSVGIRPLETRNAIAVNRAAAEKEGTRFSAQFLRLCELVDNED